MMRALLLSSLLLAAAAAPAHAAPNIVGGESPTLGVRLPAPALVGNRDASALEVNPGALGTLRAWSLLYHHTEIRSDGRFSGTGDALFFATPVPFVRAIVLGAGLQWLRPSSGVNYDDYVKLTFGLGLRLGSALSIGASFHSFVSDGDPGIDDLSSLDLGLVLRPTQWIGAAFTVRDLTTPKYSGVPLQRTYDLEIALRPCLTRRFEIGLGLRVGERRGEFDPHFRLRLSPTPGLRLETYVEVMRREFYPLRDFDTQDENNRFATDVRVGISLGFNFERIGFAVSTYVGRSLPRRGNRGNQPLDNAGAVSAFQGMGATLSLSGLRREPLVQTGRRLIRLKLGGKVNTSRMLRLLSILRRARKRRDVVGVYLQLEGLGAGWARIQELRAAIARLRKANKRVYAYVRAAGVGDYYLASAADKVWLDPDGGIGLAGLGIEQSYFKGFLDLIGVGASFVKIGLYKSAPERLTRKGSSPAAAKVRKALLDDLYRQLVTGLASSRKKTPAQMRAIIDKGPFTPPRALANGLVDKLVSPDRVARALAIATRARLASPRVLYRAPDRWPNGPALAVISIEGDIVSGKSQRIPLIGRRVVGDKTIARALRWARGNSRVRGVVLRVNSPGGSALASARMWREVARVAKVKPLIVSFGNVAASGGYYAAAAAKRILAMPGTITGSIGIFTGKLAIAGLKKKLGITTESEARGKRALLNSTNRPYSAEERAFIKKRLRYYYDRFISAVSKGRKMKKAAVDAVARGRVWTGTQAKQVKLVDAYGGLADALRELKKKLGVSPDRDMPVYVLPRVRGGLLSRILRLVGAKASDAGAEKTLRALVPADIQRSLRSVPPSLLRARSGEPMMRLPFDVKVRDR